MMASVRDIFSGSPDSFHAFTERSSRLPRRASSSLALRQAFEAAPNSASSSLLEMTATYRTPSTNYRGTTGNPTLGAPSEPRVKVSPRLSLTPHKPSKHYRNNKEDRVEDDQSGRQFWGHDVLTLSPPPSRTRRDWMQSTSSSRASALHRSGPEWTTSATR